MATNLSYNPYRAINELQQQMERLWNQAGNNNSVNVEQWSPVVDIYENENELVLLSELPGLAESDFNLSVNNNVLTISGERKLEHAKPYKFRRQERPSGQFRRSFTLPASFDLAKIGANYQDGILQIKLPKKAEARPRQIPVKAK